MASIQIVIAAFASQRDCIAAFASIAALATSQLPFAAAASWPPFAAFAAPLTSESLMLHL